LDEVATMGDGTGLRFETLEHGGEYPDTMPQAIRVTDAEGRSCLYVPVTVDGKVVDSKSFTLEPAPADLSELNDSDRRRAHSLSVVSSA
jgi:hypothetical protein